MQKVNTRGACHQLQRGTTGTPLINLILKFEGGGGGPGPTGCWTQLT